MNESSPPGLRSTTGSRPAGQRPDLVLPFVVGGIVVEGDRRGRELGYPTANVAVPAEVAAPEGVFAGAVQRADGTIYRSAISVGRRETFYSGSAPSLVEAYLLDFSGDLYGEHLRVELVRELRPQTRFDSIEALIEQIELDVVETRRCIDLPRNPNLRHGHLVPAEAIDSLCSDPAIPLCEDA
jgi:riboflavin kinase/FMN adenylyltransferase